MKIWAKFAFVYFVDFFVDFLPKTGKKPQMDFSGDLISSVMMPSQKCMSGGVIDEANEFFVTM